MHENTHTYTMHILSGLFAHSKDINGVGLSHHAVMTMKEAQLMTQCPLFTHYEMCNSTSHSLLHSRKFFTFWRFFSASRPTSSSAFLALYLFILSLAVKGVFFPFFQAVLWIFSSVHEVRLLPEDQIFIVKITIMRLWIICTNNDMNGDNDIKTETEIHLSIWKIQQLEERCRETVYNIWKNYTLNIFNVQIWFTSSHKHSRFRNTFLQYIAPRYQCCRDSFFTLDSSSLLTSFEIIKLYVKEASINWLWKKFAIYKFGFHLSAVLLQYSLIILCATFW